MADLGLRGDHVDGREDSLLGLAPVAFVLALGEPHGLDLHVEIVVGVVELPVGLDGLGDDFDDALAQLLGAELLVLARHLQAMAVLVEAQAAPQG